jgi:DNA repair protein RadC
MEDFIMTRINVYSLRLVKESAGNYDIQSPVSSPEAVYKAACDILELHEQPNEVFAILCLNTKNKIAGAHVISQGSLSSSIVHPREIFKAAILNNAASILLLHNHPSGDPTPSREDIETTKRVKEAGAILGIKVLDHIVVGDGRYISLSEQGMF